MSSSQTRILVVHNDVTMRRTIESILRRAGFLVLAKNFQQADRVVLNLTFDLMILCLKAPDPMAEDLCRKIRQTPRVRALPILILTGDGVLGENLTWMGKGSTADSTKPFDTKGLVSHVRSLLRRPRVDAPQETLIRRGLLTIETGTRRVLWDGHPIQALTPKEFELLKQLTLHAPSVVDKGILVSRVWGIPLKHLNVRSLDVHIRRIRIKLGAASSCLRTVPAIGYQWVELRGSKVPAKRAR
jgi:DNA-binding response OmpR family regulator